jgi:iron(III) transport system permease protein
VTSLSSNQVEGPAISPSARLPGLFDGKLPRRLAVAGLILLLAFLSLYPLSMLLYGSLHTTPLVSQARSTCRDIGRC